MCKGHKCKAKTKAGANKTMWLSSIPDENQNELIVFARSEGAKAKKKS